MRNYLMLIFYAMPIIIKAPFIHKKDNNRTNETPALTSDFISNNYAGVQKV